MATKKKIIVFGQRRHGTTVTFELFRKCGGLTCYYEPLHPQLIRHADWSGEPIVDTDQKHVLSEFRGLGPRLSELFCPLGAPVYPVEEELSPATWTPRHTRYFRFLLDSADYTLLQPVRINYQLDRIVRDFPDVEFVWVLRSPKGYISSVLRKDSQMLDYHYPEPHSGAARLSAAIKGPIHSLARNLVSGFRAAGAGRQRPPTAARASRFWSQEMTAEALLRMRPYYRHFANERLWVKLLITWCDAFDAVQNIRSQIGADRIHIIRYENLCKDPTRVMSDICRKLDISMPGCDIRNLVKPAATSLFVGREAEWSRAIEAVNAARQGYGLEPILEVDDD